MPKFWFSAIACTIVGILTATSLSTIAQPTQTVPHSGTTRIRYVAPTDLDTIGEPSGRRKGGAGRGSCKRYEALTALTPISQIKQKDAVLGLTTSPHPTFWFYVPAPLEAGTPIEFVLLDEQDNLLYRANVTAPATKAGVVHIALPASAPELAVNQSYRWTFAVYCNAPAGSTAGSNATTGSESMYVRGMVRRVSPSPALQQQISGAKTPLERATLYAANGIWHEALTLLGEQRLQGKEGAIAAAWTDLLQQVNLTNAATAPLGPCCQGGAK